MSELQRMTDRLGERLARSVAIDDPKMLLQTYSPHYGAVDEQRLASILHRKANDEAIEWAHLHNVATATGWVRLPGSPDRGMLSRVCVPIRFRDQLLGYLWLIDPDESLRPDELALAESAAAEAAEVMYREALSRDLERAQERELLRDLLDEAADVRAQAVTRLDEGALLDVDRPVRVLVLDTPAIDPPGDRAASAELSLAAARRLLPARRSLHLVRPEHSIFVAVTDGNTRPAELADRIRNEYERYVVASDTDAGPLASGARVGIGNEVASVDDAIVSYRQALTAVRVGRVLRLDDVVNWATLGLYRFLAELPLDRLDDDLLQPGLMRLIEADAPGLLVDTLEVFLDAAGDVKSAAEQLFVHRATLYSRLAKVESIAGVDLRNGSDRLSLHLGLKIARLSGRLPGQSR